MNKVITFLKAHKFDTVLALSLVIFTWLLVTPSPKPVVTTPLPNVTRVEVPSVTEKVVKEFIQDPAQQALIKAQADQIKKLKGEVIGLTASIARAESKGGVGLNGGSITTVSIPILPNSGGTIPSNVGPIGSNSASEFKFKDYQLNALYSSDGSKFTYGLQQEFTITTTTGKDALGHRTTLVGLTQKTPEGQKAIPVTTVDIESAPDTVRWHVSPRIQAGLALDTNGKSGLVALQWLKRGSSLAAEDTKVAFLSPTLSSQGLTILPVSVNLGQLKHNPLKDLWVSPTLNLNKSVGLAVTTTF